MPRLKKVTAWNKPECRRVTEEINKALAEVGRKLGINVARTGGGRYDESTFTVKVECSLIGADGEVRSKEAEAFKRHAHLYGLKPEQFGKTFTTFGGKAYTICGLNMRATKNPIHATNRNGKTFIFPSEQVVAMLARN
jgi:hypothetical protein